jgi:hypothetical protein
MAFYLLTYTIQEKIVLAYNDGFLGSEKIEEAQKLLPDYKSYQNRHHTWATSAVLHWMEFQPKLIRIEKFDDISNILADEKFYSTRSLVGSVCFCNIKEEYIPEIIQESKFI